MPSITDPVSNPIPITRNKHYTYVLPVSAGLVSIGSTGTDPAMTVVNVGRTAALSFIYSAAISGGPEYHSVDLTAKFTDGTLLTQTLNFLVYGDATVLPAITNAPSRNVGTGTDISFAISEDPAATGTLGAENLPAWLSVSGDRIIGTTPSTGSREIIKLSVTVAGVTHKRYMVIVVGDGGEGGGDPTLTPPVPAITVYYDGDYTLPQIAGPLQWEIPFPTDPKRYIYKITYWQYDENYVAPAIGDIGPYGGYCCGDISIKEIGGALIEFTRQFAIVPDTRNEYESFAYGYHMQFFQALSVGPNACLETFPVVVTSRLQFDYFRTDDPGSIQLDGAPAFVHTCLGTMAVNGADALDTLPAGSELLAEDAQLRIWHPGIYERRMRFVRLPSMASITS